VAVAGVPYQVQRQQASHSSAWLQLFSVGVSQEELAAGAVPISVTVAGRVNALCPAQGEGEGAQGRCLHTNAPPLGNGHARRTPAWHCFADAPTPNQTTPTPNHTNTAPHHAPFGSSCGRWPPPPLQADADPAPAPLSAAAATPQATTTA
jgi:hypothetical protein